MRMSGKQVAVIVAQFYNQTLDDLRSPVRNQMYAVPRQVCMYMLRRHAKHLSYPAIGKLLDRDHTTVLYGDRKIANLRVTDPTMAEELHELDLAIIEAKQAFDQSVVAEASSIRSALIDTQALIAPLYARLETLNGMIGEAV